MVLPAQMAMSPIGVLKAVATLLPVTATPTALLPTSQCRYGSDPHLECGSANRVPEHSNAIDDQVHGRGVGNIFGPREAGLHKHDQKAGRQGPSNIDCRNIFDVQRLR
jgi:hypothetical protein